MPGSTTDITNWYGTTYYAGVGVRGSFFSAEVKVQTVGVGAELSLGNFSVGLDINLIGASSITFATTQDIDQNRTQTTGFTVGINTGLLVALFVWVAKLVYTGDPSPVPGLAY